MDDGFADILAGIIEGRNQFFMRTINQMRPASRDTIMNRFMLNEMCLLELTNRVLHQTTRASQTAASMILNLPSNFLDPVSVAPTSAQIASATEPVATPPEDTQCAICQDAVTTDATRIRSCGHMYHPSCLTNWLTMSVRCPVCRHDIRSEHPPVQTSAASAGRSLPSTTQ